MTRFLWSLRCFFAGHLWSPVRAPGYRMGLYFWTWEWCCPCGEKTGRIADIRRLPEDVFEIKVALGRVGKDDDDRRDYAHAITEARRVRRPA